MIIYKMTTKDYIQKTKYYKIKLKKCKKVIHTVLEVALEVEETTLKMKWKN